MNSQRVSALERELLGRKSSGNKSLQYESLTNGALVVLTHHVIMHDVTVLTTLYKTTATSCGVHRVLQHGSRVLHIAGTGVDFPTATATVSFKGIIGSPVRSASDGNMGTIRVNRSSAASELETQGIDKLATHCCLYPCFVSVAERMPAPPARTPFGKNRSPLPRLIPTVLAKPSTAHERSIAVFSLVHNPIWKYVQTLL